MKLLVLTATLLAVVNVWLEGINVGWIESASLYAAVIVIVTMSAASTYWREREFETLDFWRMESEAVVRRNSQIASVSKYALVVGDIVILREGDIVPADCVILSGSLMVDQGDITGEIEWAKKSPALGEAVHPEDPFVVSGSKIMRGTGEAVVCAVGQYSQVYALHPKAPPEVHPKSALQLKLEAIADSIVV